MIENDPSPTRSQFWLAWVIANSLGFGFAWPLGETIGRFIANNTGWRTGQIIGVLIFEGFIWLARSAVLYRVKSYVTIRPLEIIIWVPVELLGWLISEAPIQQDSLMTITGGVILATSVGATMWIIFWLIRISKRHSRSWAIKTFLITLLSMVGGSALIALIGSISFTIVYDIARLSNPIIGMAIAGVVHGALLGLVTGYVFVKLLPWHTEKAGL
jgi:hypothetical protein